MKLIKKDYEYSQTGLLNTKELSGDKPLIWEYTKNKYLNKKQNFGFEMSTLIGIIIR